MIEMGEGKIQNDAQRVMDALGELIKKAQSGEDASEVFSKPITEQKLEIVIKPNDNAPKLHIALNSTGTALDKFFLTSDDKPMDGIPVASQIGIVGLPDSGKSVLIQELALRLASNPIGTKVVLVLNEDIFESPNDRFDVQSRMRIKAQTLGLDWEEIKKNLFVFDAIVHSQLREFQTLVTTYRQLVEKEGVKFLLVDSLTLLEDTRGALKYRLAELIRYNQLHGVMGFYVSQRSTEDSDLFGMAGGISLSHLLDTVFALDYKKLWSGDGQIKMDTGAKQGENIRFIRCLKNRMGRFDARYWRVEIDKDGNLKMFEPKPSTVKPSETL
jgi:KaiC/GvpD/RAD55 family RecA-like ATPase